MTRIKKREYLMTAEMIDGKRNRGEQRGKVMDGLSGWVCTRDGYTGHWELRVIEMLWKVMVVFTRDQGI